MTIHSLNDPGLRELLVQSFSAVLRDHMEEVSLATRARLAEAAMELRADAAPSGPEDPIITAARKLEALAYGGYT